MVSTVNEVGENLMSPTSKSAEKDPGQRGIENLPDELLMLIARHLPAEDIVRWSAASRKFYYLLSDDFLWKSLISDHLKIPEDVLDEFKSKYNVSFRDKYLSIVSTAPTICAVDIGAPALPGHVDEVLHAAFNHRGDMIVTCSKDGYCMVWSFDRSTLKVDCLFVICGSHVHHGAKSVGKNSDMEFRENWQYPQIGMFSPDDSMLGVSVVGPDMYNGSVFVYSISKEACKKMFSMILTPYDVFGQWGQFWVRSRTNIYKTTNETFLVSGICDMHESQIFAVGPITAGSFNDDQLTKHCLFKQRNQNANTLRMVRLVQLPNRSHVLICMTGTETFAPHQVGLKVIDEFPFGRTTAIQSFDKFDYKYEFGGHIVGYNVTSDFQLFINYRRWEDRPDPELDAIPPLAQEIDIGCINLIKKRRFPPSLMTSRAARAFTGVNGCYFVGVSASSNFVASGGEDSYVTLFDRELGCLIRKIEHGIMNKVVNFVDFYPFDEQILLSSSDDMTAKIWISKLRRLDFANFVPVQVITRDLTQPKMDQQVAEVVDATNDQPADDQALPTDSKALPTDAQALPADSQARPADSQVLPESGSSAPPVPQEHPTATDHSHNNNNNSSSSSNNISSINNIITNNSNNINTDNSNNNNSNNNNNNNSEPSSRMEVEEDGPKDSDDHHMEVADD